jgi:hypothetical protein
MVTADDLATFLHNAPGPVRVAYCSAWRSDKALWLSAWPPTQRVYVRLVMRRICR